MPLDEDDVREILRLIDESDVEELRVETEAFSLYVRRGDRRPAPLWPRKRRRRRPAGRLHPILAPMLGTFYRAPAPGAAPFVDVGARVEKDTVVCLIEVMKMMNAVPAGIAGTIVEVCAENAAARRVRRAALPRRAGSERPRRHRRHDDPRRQPEPLERDRPDDGGHPRDRADDRPRRLPRRRLQLEHAHGRRRSASTARIPGSGSASSARRCPNTPLSFITPGMRFITWVPADEDVMRLAFRCVARNGIRRFQIVDPSNDPPRLRRVAAMARQEGVEQVVLGLTYSVSEVHTHAYYAERAQRSPTAPRWTPSTSRIPAGC